MTRYAVGVDIGGTFTDFAVHDGLTGEIIAMKSPTVPSDPVQGLIEGLRALEAERGVRPAEIGTFVHGTTIAVNTLIQRNGSRLGLVVTQGFGDLLELQRQALPTVQDWNGDRPKALIPRQHVFQIAERLRADGRVHQPLETAALPAIVATARQQGLQGLVLCFLHAYRNPAHEHAARDELARLAPDLFVCCSADIWPQMREYERALISIINAYVMPKVDAYLEQLERRLAEAGVPAVPYITRSNGGMMTARGARLRPAETLLSGPASGVTGAIQVARALEIGHFVTLDIGGTSADVAFVEDGRALISQSEHIADFPIMMPVVGVSSVGAGGGSIIWLDDAGVLRIGPDSVGSDPGPACYGRGGMVPALTDGLLAGGYLDAEGFAGGRVRLRTDLADAAIGPVAAALGLGLHAAIDGILRVTVATLYAEISNLAAQRGVDLREYVLLPFGGAGALLACMVADEVGISRVALPATPGTLCALGALGADVSASFVTSLTSPLTGAAAVLRHTYGALLSKARAWLAREATATTNPEISLSASMRYTGQSFEIDVALQPAWIETADLDRIAAGFHDTHARVYGHADASLPAEIVDLRLTVSAADIRPMAQASPRALPVATAAPRFRTIHLAGHATPVPVWRRDGVPPALSGPALIDQADTTTFIPPGWTASVHPSGALLLERTV